MYPFKTLYSTIYFDINIFPENVTFEKRYYIYFQSNIIGNKKKHQKFIAIHKLSIKMHKYLIITTKKSRFCLSR